MAAARIIFSIVLLVYQFKKYYFNFKLTRFQKSGIWMIQSLTLLQVIYSIYWNYRVFKNCELYVRDISAFIDINMFIIGIMITFYMYQAVNMIHQFSLKGRLPREQARKRFLCFIWTLVVFTAAMLAVYVVFNQWFSMKHNHSGLEKLNRIFAITRAAGFMANICILSFTIRKLKQAKVNRTDSGHLNMRDATVLLILLFLMMGTGLAGAYVPIDMGLIYIDCFKDIFDFMIGMMYFKMIINFITTFRLQTKVNKDGSIDIVGIEPNGGEVFKF